MKPDLSPLFWKKTAPTFLYILLYSGVRGLRIPETFGRVLATILYCIEPHADLTDSIQTQKTFFWSLNPILIITVPFQPENIDFIWFLFSFKPWRCKSIRGGATTEVQRQRCNTSHRTQFSFFTKHTAFIISK